MKKQEFIDFEKTRKVYDEIEAIKQFYNNNYSEFINSVECIYTKQTDFYDYIYYYDKQKDIIIENSYYVGD